MSKKKTEIKVMTREEQIAAIQTKLKENPPAREYAALSRTLAQLTGALRTYARTKADQQPKPTPEELDTLPKWWSDMWARVFICERLQGIRSGDRWLRELERYTAEWAKQEGLTVEQLCEALRREDAEREARLFPNGFPKNTEEWME